MGFYSFQPHITLTYDGARADLSKVEAYQGKLVFGPEVFEPIDEEWSPREASFAAPDAPRDLVEEAAIALLEEHGWKPLSPLLTAVLDAIEQAGSIEELDAALLAQLPKSDFDALARAGFAVRMAAETGNDG